MELAVKTLLHEIPKTEKLKFFSDVFCEVFSSESFLLLASRSGNENSPPPPWRLCNMFRILDVRSSFFSTSVKKCCAEHESILWIFQFRVMLSFSELYLGKYEPIKIYLWHGIKLFLKHITRYKNVVNIHKVRKFKIPQWKCFF